MLSIGPGRAAATAARAPARPISGTLSSNRGRPAACKLHGLQKVVRLGRGNPPRGSVASLARGPRFAASAGTTDADAWTSEIAREIEFAVKMSCGKCVASVESAAAGVAGVEAVSANLEANTVRVVASAGTTVEAVRGAISMAGFEVRLIGQGALDQFGEDLAARLGTNLRTLHQSLAAVAEFKGEAYGHGGVKGVVRFVQVDEETCLIEGQLDGLAGNEPYALSIRTYGDTSEGARTAGGVYEAGGEDGGQAGDLGRLEADASGRAVVASRVVDGRVKVWDIIGRSVAVEKNGEEAIVAVLARSAGVGDNLKQLCHCDGTVIWESTPDDFKPQGTAAA